MKSKGNAPTAAQERWREAELTANDLNRLFEYEPITGVIRWRVSPARRVKVGDKAGTIIGNQYLRVSIMGRLYMAHRVIWCLVTGDWPKNQVDHIDRNKANNRWSNLRDVTQEVNQANTGLRKTNTSGVKGLSIIRSKGKEYWLARKIVDGRRVQLGVRKSRDQAEELLNAT